MDDGPDEPQKEHRPLLSFLMGLGMLPNADGLNRLSFYFGAAGQAMQEPPEEAPSKVDKKTGELLGRRVAEVTKKLHG